MFFNRFLQGFAILIGTLAPAIPLYVLVAIKENHVKRIAKNYVFVPEPLDAALAFGTRFGQATLKFRRPFMEYVLVVFGFRTHVEQPVVVQVRRHFRFRHCFQSTLHIGLILFTIILILLLVYKYC